MKQMLVIGVVCRLAKISQRVVFRFYPARPRTSMLGRCSAACMHTATSSMALDMTDKGSVSPILKRDGWWFRGEFCRAAPTDTQVVTLASGHFRFDMATTSIATTRYSSRGGLDASIWRGRRATASTSRRDGVVSAPRRETFSVADDGRRGTQTRGLMVATPESVLAVIATTATLGQVMEDNTGIGARVSAPIMTMGATAVLATVGVLPATSVIYDAVWRWIMPLSVIFALLSGGSNVRELANEEGRQVFKSFIVGACGTIFATFAAFNVCGASLGEFGWKIASCLCSSYIGGSVNFASTAQAVDMMSSGGQALLTAGMAADNVAMAVYLGVLMLVQTPGPRHLDVENADVRQNIPCTSSVAASLAVSLIVLRASQEIAHILGQPSLGLGVACLLTPIASCVTRRLFKSNEKLDGNLSSTFTYAGAQAMSGVGMLLFFATLGAMADLRIVFNAITGGSMILFIATLLSVQLAFSIIVGHKLLRLPLWSVLTAANANVGGPATAAAMTSARGWHRATAPAILTGVIGYSVATIIGVTVGNVLNRL
jgi:uncharacterized membrane protein